MKVDVVHASRRPPWPLWAAALVLAWLALGSLAIWLADYRGRDIQLCTFKRLSGVACPTCGFTRGALHFVRGHLIRAWLCNPFLFTVLGLFFAATGLRLGFARRVKVQLTRAERTIALVLVVGLFLLNWAYVIVYVG